MHTRRAHSQRKLLVLGTCNLTTYKFSFSSYASTCNLLKPEQLQQKIYYTSSRAPADFPGGLPMLCMYSYKSQVQVDLAVVAEVRSFHIDGLHSCVECGSKSHQAWPLVGLPVLPSAIHIAKGKRFANLFRRIFKQIYRQLRIGTVGLRLKHLEPLVGCSLRASGNALIDQFRYVVQRVRSESRYLRRSCYFLPFAILHHYRHRFLDRK